MYSLKEAWVLMHGGLPFKNWNGRIYCNTTDASITFRANETHGYMAAYTFTLVVEGWLSIIYNGQELTLHPDDMYIYSPGLAVTIISASDDYRGICLLADEHISTELPTVRDMVHIAAHLWPAPWHHVSPPRLITLFYQSIMKHLILATLLCISAFSQADTVNNTTNMPLTTRQQSLALIASFEAQGDIERLKTALNEGFDNGLSLSEAKEALSQLYAYTGFPRSLNALGALQQVVAARTAAGLTTAEGRDADPLPEGYDALRQGTEVQTQLVGGKPFNYMFAPQTDYYLKAHLFGDIFARNNLTFADRELVTVSAIAALPGCEPQLRAHVAGARNMGVSDDELNALPTLLETKVGACEAERLRGALSAVAGGTYQPVQTVDFSVWPRGEVNPYSQFFTGTSYLADMGGVMNVTFEPRCRNNWHVHHKAVQVLICVAGRGWYQEWGKPAIEMRPGSVIAIPAEVKHWHGAAKDSWFQHLTYHTNVQEGSSNEWLEPVTDDIYDTLQ